jgi:hypothetical protein
LVPSGPEDLTNKEYVDSQKGAAVIESNLYTDTQISAFQISQIGPYYRFFVTSAITGASASFTDPVTNLTARGYYTLYADTGGGAVFFDGINGISITASDDEETYNKVIEIDGVPGVTSATEIVNRIIIDAKALGHAPQVWTNMLSSRSNGTNYVNTTSRPIMVMVKPDFQTSVQISVGATHTGGGMVTIYSNNNSMEPPSFVVPISHVYNVTFGSFPTSPNGSWMELR